MPITIAHPAAVMPIRRWGLPFSALVVGSISPDLEYLTHFTPIGCLGANYSSLLYSHELSGIFTFCLPVSLLLLLLVHKIWRPAAVSLLSDDSYLARELQDKPFSFRPASSLGLVCLGVLVGAFSHVLWDSFTHSYGWVVQNIPALRETINPGDGITVPLYRVFQHISTVIGIAVLSAYAIANRWQLGRLTSEAWQVILFVVFAGAAGGLGAALVWIGFPDDLTSFQRFLVNSIAFSFAVTVTSVTLLSIAWHVARRYDPGSEEGTY